MIFKKPLIYIMAIIFIALCSQFASALDFAVTLGSQYKMLMGEGYGVVEHVVTNDPTSARAIKRVVFDLDASGTDNYDFLSFSPPAGWVITSLTADSLTVESTANGYDILAGASLTFSLRFSGEGGGTIPAGASDETLASDSIYQVSAFYGTGNPGGWAIKTGATASPDWTRVGFLVELGATPASTNPASNITVSMSITNRTTATKNGITSNPSDPTMTYSGPGAITKNSGPTSSLNLASGESGIISWTYWANSSSSGAVYWSGAATHSSGATTGLSVDSNVVTIANFACEISMDKTTVVSGELVTVTMTVTNNGTSSLTNVAPSALTVGGTATGTLSTGPTPASVASLGPGANTNFQWTYTITGSVDQTYNFTGNATATGPVSSNSDTTETGSIVTISAAISPKTTSTGSTNVTYTFTIQNDSNRDIDEVWLTFPSGFTYSSSTAGDWTVDTTSSPVIKFIAGTAIASRGGVKSDFQMTFSSVPSPSSNTNYDFSVKTIDTASGEWTGTCTVTITAYSIVIDISPNDTAGTAIDADGSGVTTLTATLLIPSATGSDLSANGSSTVTSAGASFSSSLQNGDRFYISGRGTFTVSSVSSDTTVVLDGAVASGSGLSYKGGVGVTGKTVNFSASNGTLQSSSAVSDGNGDATVSLTAPSSATDTTGNCQASYSSYSDSGTAYWNGYSAPSLVYVGNTLHTIPNNNPADRMMKQTASYSLTVDVSNQSSTTGMTCYAASTHIVFTDGTDSYDAYLSSDTAVAASAQVTLTFTSTAVSANVDLGKYQPTLYINDGQGAGSPNYAQTRAVSDYLYVLESTDAFIGGFNVRGGKGSALVKWRTIKETQNAGFNVYRADVTNTSASFKRVRVKYNLDGANFSKMTANMIRGVGSSDKPKDYFWIDRSATSGRVYLYAIESVSFRGAKVLHKPYLLVWISEDKKAEEDLVAWTGSNNQNGNNGSNTSSTAGKVEYVGEISLITADAGGNGVLLSWVAPDSANIVSYDVYRSNISKYDTSFRAQKSHSKFNLSEFAKITGSSLFALGHNPSLPFQYFDVNVREGETYLYMVSSKDNKGKVRRYSPYVVAFVSGELVTVPDIAYVELKPGGNNVKWPGLERPEPVVTPANPTEPSEDKPVNQPPKVVRVSKGYLDGEAFYKIIIRETGFYQIDSANIALMGIDGTKAHHLYYRGVKVPLQRLSDENGQLTAFRFYAESYEDLYTDENVYWLVQRELEDDGDDVKTLVADYGAAPGSGDSPKNTYSRKVRLEENKLFYKGLPGGTEGESHWFFGDFLYDTATFTRNIEVTDRFVDAPKATIRLQLRGITGFNDIENDHHIKVYVNGAFAGELRWDGLTVKNETLTIDSYHLKDGANEIKLECPGDTGAPYEYVFIDWAELEYTRKIRSQGGSVQFAVNNLYGGEIVADGFSSNDIIVLDVTDSKMPKLYSELHVAATGDGTFYVRFKGETGTRQYFVLEQNSIKAPVQIIEDVKADLRKLKVDYVIISHSDFLGELEPLANFHRGTGLSVAIVDVRDVYDEFGYGVYGPEAIRNFLREIKPRYALLVGDTTYDYRDYEGKGITCYIPSFFAESDEWYSTNDNQLACIEGDDRIPDVALGRFPVRTAAECRVMVEKVLAYSSQSGAAKDAVFVADDDDSFFRSNSEAMAQELSGWKIDKLYLVDYADKNAIKPDIVSALNSGTNLMIYVGHGAITSWESNQILKSGDVGALNNGNHLAVFIQLTCLTNYFSHTNSNYDSLSEVLLKTTGRGAVASFASTGRSTPGIQFVMGKVVLRHLALGSARLGDAILSGKRELSRNNEGDAHWVLDSFILLGDPALPIRSKE